MLVICAKPDSLNFNALLTTDCPMDPMANLWRKQLAFTDPFEEPEPSTVINLQTSPKSKYASP